jgi:hypothetical protein
MKNQQLNKEYHITSLLAYYTTSILVFFPTYSLYTKKKAERNAQATRYPYSSFSASRNSSNSPCSSTFSVSRTSTPVL